VQLNRRFSKQEVPPLRELLQAHPRTVFITQHNTANFNVWPLLSDLPNYAVLFDRSLGRGTTPSIWPCPLMPATRVACGYAGGLGAHNLAEQLPRIEQAVAGESFWVDMESSLRGSRDRFDLLEAEKVAQLVLRRCPPPAG
jgi:hypothetical protein